MQLDDTWEKFKVRFTIFYPITQQGDKLKVVTETHRNMLEQGPPPTVIDLHRAPQSMKWMNHKYGQDMHPWVGYMMLPNVVSGNDGQFEEIHKDASKWYYTYQKKNDHKSEIVLERLPMRNI